MPEIDSPIPSTIVWNTVDDEALLLDIETGSYFSLDPIATKIWTGLSEGRSQEAIASELAQVYGVETEVIQNDIADLLLELTKAGLWK